MGHFSGAILSANKGGGELLAHVSGACDNYTMVCVCFSWALSFSRSLLTLGGSGKDRRAIMRCLEQLSQTLLFLNFFFLGCGSTKSRGRLLTAGEITDGKDNERKSVRCEEEVPAF